MPRKTRDADAWFDHPMPASMRPRPDAAENGGHAQIGLQPIPASMRPRPDAAENPARSPNREDNALCFNEAAARCRGKLQIRGSIQRFDSELQ